MPTNLTPHTLIYGFTPAGDPDVSPDGSRLLYTLARTDAESKKSLSQVWVCDIDGTNARQLTSAGERNRGARWSPDGTQIAFVSDRVEASGLFVLPMTGGEARELARHPTGISDLAWSPDASKIAYTAVVDPLNPTGTKLADGAAPPVRVTSRIDYKQDNRGYLNDTRTQVFAADVAAGGHVQLTTEAVDHRSPAWSPDGKTLAIGVSTNNGMTSRLLLLGVADATATWVGPEDGNIGTWAWSPDGSRIAYTGDPDHTYQSDVFLYDVASKETRRVTTDLPCAPYAGFPTLEPASMPVWLDDHTILFHANFRAASGLWTVDLESGAVTQEEGTESLRVGFSTDRANRYVAQGMASLDAIGEIIVIDREAGTSRVVTSMSAPVFAESPVAAWERFDVRRGEFVTEAWMLKPPGFDPAKNYPVILDVHGGPNGFYGYAFNAMQQLLASNGYIVLFSNP
ncbi:MAG TPA: hypothetical protein VN697_13870, partial [Tepidiformaceae bacterium]|nr:hypothetical protein [Tepidiformaceae bacterium]